MLRFTALFALFAGLLFLATLTPIAEERGWPAYLGWNTSASGAILRTLGQDARVDDRVLTGPGFSLLIERGCDAVHPSALFVAAVLASPVAWWAKLPGILAGTLLLMAINLVRIVSLFYVKIHAPRLFEVLHVEVWQALFILLAVLLWAAWALWALRRADARDAVALPADRGP